jgi:CheY-like chemotaxis protein
MSIVLVIDDEQQIRGFLRRILERAGHQVVEAATGVEGIAICEQQSPDLVFCDLNMPGQGGLATIGELRKHRPNIGIIAISVGTPGTAVDFLSMASDVGADRALNKPFGSVQVLEAVMAVLGNSNAQS